MQIGNRFRIYPTSAQKHILLQWIGCQRFIYNAKVSEDQYFRRFARKSLSLTGEFAPIDQQYSHFKTDLTPWLSDVPSIILRNGTVLWKQAYSRYFQKLGGRPVIHKKTGKQSVWITSELFEFPEQTNKDTGEVTYDLKIGTVSTDDKCECRKLFANDGRYLRMGIENHGSNSGKATKVMLTLK